MKRRVMARRVMARRVTSRRSPAKRLIAPIAGLVVLVVGLVAISGMLPRSPGDGPVVTSTQRVALLPTSRPQTPSPGGSVAVPTGVVPTDGTSEPPLATPGVPTGNDGLIVDWLEAPNPGLGVVIGQKAAASSNGRVVVTGIRTDEYLPGLWSSGDGTTWQLADFPDAANNAFDLTGLTAGGPGFVVFGYDNETDAAVTYASTDSMSWQRGSDPDLAGQNAHMLGAAGSKVVAFAESGAVFTSSDGLSWDPALDASALEVADGLLNVTSYAGSLWAFSEATAPEEVLPPVDVWRTDDGIAWVLMSTIPDSSGAFDARAASGPLGLVLLADIDREGVLGWLGWQSADGATWQAATNNPSDATDILADDAGFIAVGVRNSAGGCVMDETENVGVTWTSVNGLIWRQMPDEGWQGRAVQVLGVIGRTLVGVGIDWNLLFGLEVADSGLSWTSALPAEAHDDGPPPEPTPEPTPPTDCG